MKSLCLALLPWLACSVAIASQLEWQPGKGFRSAGLTVPQNGHAGFSQLASAVTGITFTNFLSQDRYTTNTIYLNGSGVTAGDVDGDGWCDLYFCGLDGPNVLYRNLGNWKFADIAQSAGVACANLDCSGAAFADIDGDGYLDLLVNTIGAGTHCFINDGKGRFTDITASSGLASNQGSMSMALADIDGDGDLDLYVANYRTMTVQDQPDIRLRGSYIGGKPVVISVDGRPTTEPDLVGRFTLNPNGKIIENGEVDVLYRNDGGGKFTPLSFTDGIFLDEDGKPLTGPPYDWGLSVMFRDINGDGVPDIYVCNDFGSPDRIWVNDGKGRFRAISRLSLRTTSMFSMGIDFADLNRDGYDEIFVADMLSRSHSRRHVQVSDIMPTFRTIGQIEDRPQFSHNTLFLNRRDGTFAEVAQFSGVDASEWSWTPIFLDVDLDGYEDLLITTGHERDSMNADIVNRIEALQKERKLSTMEKLNLRKLYTRLDVGNVAFRNRGDLTFEEVSAAWGFNTPGVSHGMALADLDNDGDLDIVVNNLNGPAGVYRNETIAPRIAVRLKGQPPNTRGIGAKLKILGGPVMQSQEMICGGRYLSSDDPMRAFAAGNLTNELTIEVAWRSGRRSVIPGARANRVYEIDESGAFEVEARKPTIQNDEKPPLFRDVSELIAHVHHEEPFDDFARQPLLPRRLSQLGPGVTWHDVDGDGWEDLIVGSGHGGQLNVFLNDRKGGFKSMHGPPVNQTVTRDQTTILGWSKGQGKTILLGGSANYEDGLPVGSVVRQYDLAGKVMDDRLPGQTSSTGPLAMGDIDGDGDLDLFVGGRTIPGRYPEPASSLLFRDTGGKWELDAENAKALEKAGLVSGAVWSDLDGDGFPELILACEWGPVRVFRNERGTLKEETKELGLAEYQGWWNGVTTGDIDGDGNLDIIASNWGLNSRYQASREHPRRLYYGDLDGNGTVDLVETYYNERMGKEVPDRGLKAIGSAMPFVKEKMPTYEAYGRASLEEIYGQKLKSAGLVEVNTLATMVFLNRGGRFEGVALPLEAQLAPAFGVCVGDMDGDGTEDLFLSQNFFATNPDASRNDAGRGLWLRNDGKGRLTPMPGQESGVKVYGEQRGCALCDYDGDGRVDVAVTQNGNATKLFHNEGAKPGLRVRLSGVPGNPQGVGASIRLVRGKVMGPIREIHAGSGYWSQDGAVQVMGFSEEPTQVWVRWPGGRITTSAVHAGAREMVVDTSGQVKVVR